MQLRPQCSLPFYLLSTLSSGSAWCHHRNGKEQTQALTWFCWSFNLILLTQRSCKLFACLFVSHVWTLYPSSSKKDRSPHTFSTSHLIVLPFYCSCHVNALIRVSLSESTARWGWECNRGLLCEDWPLFSRSIWILMVWTKIWEQTLLPVKEKQQSDNMPLKKILLIDPKIKPQKTDSTEQMCQLFPSALLSAGGSCWLKAPCWCETLFFFFLMGRSDCAAFFFLWTLHYWGMRRLGPELAPATNKLFVYVCLSEIVVYLV